MYTIQVRKKGSKVISPIEIDQSIVPIIRLLALSEEPRVNLKEHEDEIFEYLGSKTLPGSALLIRLLKQNDRVELVKHS